MGTPKSTSGRSAADTVIVVGAGPIGLASAWRLGCEGFSVVVVDPRPGSGASHAAAGMLAPVSEAHYGETDLLALNLESARLYPSFVAELENRTGMTVAFRHTGTLTVAFDAGDRGALDDLVGYHLALGLDVERIGGREARRLEPALAPGIASGVLVPGDDQVEPRLLTTALQAACRKAGVSFVARSAKRVVVRDGAVRGVELDEGSVLGATRVLVAAGTWSPPLVADALGKAGLDDLPIRPVKGQIMTMRPQPGLPLPSPFLTHNVRALVEGRPIYLVPRTDGRVVLGATVEEKGFDIAVTVEAVYDLLRLARKVLPSLAELELVETTAGLRPGSPDNAPMIGALGPEGLIVAAGHFRNGILLTPLTASLVLETMRGDGRKVPRAAFSPLRFTSSSAGRAQDGHRPVTSGNPVS